jgi:hypothetical protein
VDAASVDDHTVCSYAAPCSRTSPRTNW